MEPSEFHKLKSKLIVIEEEVDEIERREDLDVKVKNTQRRRLAAIAASVCDDYEGTEADNTNGGGSRRAFVPCDQEGVG